jgi:class 3 adenylate cyclase
MSLKAELDAYVRKTHADVWAKRDGQQVPDTDDLSLGNDAVLLEGTVLYADLAESTGLVSGYKDWFAAEVYKNYLYCAARIVRLRGGVITAYDGDRVMAVFLGDSKNSEAAKCGLHIAYAAKEILRPAITAKYPENTYALKQKVGVDTSSLFIARTGIRGSNDLVWVGNAANNAAKMAALSTDYTTYISATVYHRLREQSRYGGESSDDMWTDLGTSALGYKIYGSNWTWSF